MKSIKSIKSMKKTKKTTLTIITLSVVTSILMTVAAAEEIYFNSLTTADMPYPVAVMTAPPLTSEPLQSQPMTPDTAGTESGGADESSITSALNSSRTFVSVDPDAETDTDNIPPAPLPDLVCVKDLQRTAGQTIADFSKQYDGFRYIYGAASPKSGFDCSGLVYYVYTNFGYTLPRTASRQYTNGISVENADLLPGDLVFFATNGGSRAVSHVGIFIGDGQFIHAATSRHGVMINSLSNSYWAKALIGAKRIITPQLVLQQSSQPAHASLL